MSINPILAALNGKQAQTAQQMPNNTQPLAQRVADFKQDMLSKGITDPRAEVMKQLQMRAIPPNVMQKLQSTAQLMGLSLY